MNRFIKANISDGNDWKTLSFIFNLTANPESISSVNPAEAKKINIGEKKYPKIKPNEPINCKHPVRILCLPKPNLTNSSFIFFDNKQLIP